MPAVFSFFSLLIILSRMTVHEVVFSFSLDIMLPRGREEREKGEYG